MVGRWYYGFCLIAVLTEEPMVWAQTLCRWLGGWVVRIKRRVWWRLHP